MKKERQVLIKPVSSDCNMRCGYCFYCEEAGRRLTSSYGKMTQETMELAVVQALQSVDSCVFGFQGGEPTLAGKEFYRQFAEIVRREKRPDQKVFFTLQTNGLLLDEEWADFLKKEGYLVGISIDGTKELHDYVRKDAVGKGTYTRILRNAQLLRKKGVPVNILCVLTKQNARRVRSIYQNLKKEGFFYHQYIPYLEPEGGEPLDKKTYGRALCDLFDLWYEDRKKGTPVYVREFDNWLTVLLGGHPEACTMYGKCTMQNVIEANGNVYPCDFYALDEYCMGNIHEISLEEMEKTAQNPSASVFFADAQRRDDRCASCRWYPLCRGGCRRYCDITEKAARNRFCEAYQEFFTYAIGRLEELAAKRGVSGK